MVAGHVMNALVLVLYTGSFGSESMYRATSALSERTTPCGEFRLAFTGQCTKKMLFTFLPKL